MTLFKYNGAIRTPFSIIGVLYFCLATNVSHAKTYLVPPYSIKNNHPVTDTILRIAKEFRARGYRKQANQLEKLLKEKKIFYRVNHPNSNDFQYVIDQKFIKGDEWAYTHIEEQLYISLATAGYIPGKGPHRIDRKTFYATIVSMLHELTHKDIGEDGQRSSETHEATRGYQLHEIEAYRRSFKWFVDTWVVADLKDYLDKAPRSCSKREHVDELQDLLERVEIMHDRVEGFGTLPTKGTKPYPYYGDKACRWKAAKKGLQRLRDVLSAKKMDCESKYSCQANKAGSARYRQASIETGLKVRNLTDQYQRARNQLRSLRRADRRTSKKLNAALRKLRLERDQKRRLALAREIASLDAARKTLHTRLKEARSDYRSILARLRVAKAQDRVARKRYLTGLKNYDKCRIRLVKQRLKSGAINRNQLPPDMAVTKGGQLQIVGKNKARKLDLTAATDKVKDLFDYDVTLTGELDEPRPAKDPRTPCYTPAKTTPASTKPAPKVDTGGTSLNKPAGPKRVGKPKKKCKRRGLIGAVDCVTERMSQ